MNRGELVNVFPVCSIPAHKSDKPTYAYTFHAFGGNESEKISVLHIHPVLAYASIGRVLEGFECAREHRLEKVRPIQTGMCFCWRERYSESED